VRVSVEDVLARPPGALGADCSRRREQQDQSRLADVLVELRTQLVDAVEIRYGATACPTAGREYGHGQQDRESHRPQSARSTIGAWSASTSP
jgi:hypothetical protein